MTIDQLKNFFSKKVNMFRNSMAKPQANDELKEFWMTAGKKAEEYARDKINDAKLRERFAKEYAKNVESYANKRIEAI